MSVFPNLIYRFNTIPIKRKTASYFGDINKPILKFIGRDKRPRIVSTTLKEKNKVIRETSPNFQTPYKAIGIKAVWYWQKNRHINQWNRIESSEQTQTSTVNCSLTKEQRLFNGERMVFSTNGTGELDIHIPKNECRYRLHTLHKN